MSIDYIEVQQRLAALGFYTGRIDGARGPKTDAAIIAFKRSIGLRARPYLGPITLRALMSNPVEASDIPWMTAASDVRGLHEARNRTALVKWFDASVSWFDPREVPWCGAFVATCYRKWQPDIDLPENPLGARNWRNFGMSCEPVFGACLVFWRGSRQGWKGHVGFYHGEDDSHFHVLGGNQQNAVTVTRISKDRLLGARWPKGEPIDSDPIRLTAAGVPVTTNEA